MCGNGFPAQNCQTRLLLLHHPALDPQTADALDPHSLITATSLPPVVTGDRQDLHDAVAVLCQQAV